MPFALGPFVEPPSAAGAGGCGATAITDSNEEGTGTKLGRGRSSSGVERAGALPGRASNPDATTLGRLLTMILGRFDAGAFASGLGQIGQDVAPEGVDLLCSFPFGGKLGRGAP